METVELKNDSVTETKINKDLCIICNTIYSCQFFDNFCNECFRDFLNKYIISFYCDDDGNKRPLINLQINKSVGCPENGCQFHTWVKYETNEHENFFHTKMPLDGDWGIYSCPGGVVVEKNNNNILYSSDDDNHDDYANYANKHTNRHSDDLSDNESDIDDFDDAYEACDLCNQYEHRCHCE